MLSVLLLLPQPPSQFEVTSFVVLHTGCVGIERYICGLGHTYFFSYWAEPAQFVCTQSGWLSYLVQAGTAVAHWAVLLAVSVDDFAALEGVPIYSSPFLTAVDSVDWFCIYPMSCEILSVWTLFTCFGVEWALYMFTAKSYDLFDEGVFPLNLVLMCCALFLLFQKSFGYLFA